MESAGRHQLRPHDAGAQRLGDGRREVLIENEPQLEPSSTPMRLVRRGKGLVATSDEPLPRFGADDVRAIVEAMRR